MKFSRIDANRVNFANWCIREKKEPAVIMELCKMAERIFRMSEANANGVQNDSRMVAACGRMRVEVKRVFGESADIHWPGFWPVIQVFVHGEGNVDLRLPI